MWGSSAINEDVKASDWSWCPSLPGSARAGDRACPVLPSPLHTRETGSLLAGILAAEGAAGAVGEAAVAGEMR